MPFLTPLAAAPTGAGSDPQSYEIAHPGTVYRAQSGDAVTVLHQAVNAAVALRPYFWVPDDGSGKIASGGRWVGIGYDATSGATPSAADPASGNACAHGRYQDEDSGGRHWILVAESGMVANSVWALLTVSRRQTVI